jgi:hypothetical protein
LAVFKDPVFQTFEAFFVGKEDFDLCEVSAVSEFGADEEGIEQNGNCC